MAHPPDGQQEGTGDLSLWLVQPGGIEGELLRAPVAHRLWLGLEERLIEVAPGSYALVQERPGALVELARAEVHEDEESVVELPLAGD